MAKLKVLNIKGEAVGDVAASDKVFARPANQNLVHQAVVWFLAAKRSGTHSSKTRAEVRGGGKKPWRQKGTGRARAGSIRSPLWRTGGVIFGPKPRSYNYAFPKKMRKAALQVALSEKVRDKKLIAVDELKLEDAKTKAAAKVLKGLKVTGKCLVVLSEKNEIFSQAARNIKGLVLTNAACLNIFDLINAEWVVIEKEVLTKLEEVLS